MRKFFRYPGTVGSCSPQWNWKQRFGSSATSFTWFGSIIRTTWCAFKKLQNMGGHPAWISVLSMLSGLQRPSVQKGLIETPDQISFIIKKALEMQGPVIIDVEVDYRDNYRFMEIMHPDVLD